MPKDRTKAPNCSHYWNGCGRRYSLFQGFLMILSLATFFARNPNGYLSSDPTRFNLVGFIVALFFPVPYLIFTILVPPETAGGTKAATFLYFLICIWALVLWGIRNKDQITGTGIMGLFVALFFPYIYILYAYADPIMHHKSSSINPRRPTPYGRMKYR